MSLAEHTISLPFEASLVEWANLFAHLPGFAYLDSGDQTGGTERELLTALPTARHTLRHYSGDMSLWMTAIEAALAHAHHSDETAQTSGSRGSCIAIGHLDYDTPASYLIGRDAKTGASAAHIYHWVMVSDFAARSTQVVFHPDCSEATRHAVSTIIKSGLDALQRGETRSQTGEVRDQSTFSISAPFEPSISKTDYRDAIRRIQDYIVAGDCYQVNYAQRFKATLQGDTWAAYQAVRGKLAGGFSGFLRQGEDHTILSLSPERFLQIHDGVITTQPIKGTAPRHLDVTSDRASAASLLKSDKDRAENVMITDLLRNDLGRFCEAGSVKVTELCGLHSFDNVHHLISTITGQLASGVSAGNVMIASSPGGSITGAPKKRAVEIIAELEPHDRGAYCGSLFAMTGDGWLQSSIAIRTLEAKGTSLYCWGGGGITASSHWEAEYQETLDKIGPIMKSLETHH
jgi:para-aminobenzoate synthetase component 1